MIHWTAVIDKGAIIEDNVDIGPYSVIGPETVIKSGTKIHGQSTIEYAEIGNNCEIFNFSSIGKRPQDLKYQGEKTKVVLGDGTTIRECVTLNRGTMVGNTGYTVVGKNCLLMSCAHVAHDCIIGDGVILGYSTAIAGHVEIGEHAVLSASIGVHQFCKIGKSAMIGAGSMINMDVIPYVTAYGDRAIIVGLNLIGLKRNKIKVSEIQSIKSAYKILFMSKLTLDNAMAKLEDSTSPYVKDIMDFIRNSQRGITRPKLK